MGALAEIVPSADGAGEDAGRCVTSTTHPLTICIYCQMETPKWDPHRNWCLTCHNAYHNAKAKQAYENGRAMAVRLLGGVCYDCDGTERLMLARFEPRADGDTRSPSKFFTRGMRGVLLEAAGCDLVCYPCYRKRRQVVPVTDELVALREKRQALLVFLASQI